MSLLRDDGKLDNALRKRILISHDPDGRRIDSEEFLIFIESILFCNTLSHSSASEVKCLSDFQLIAAHEPLGQIISKASRHTTCTSDKQHDLSPRVMALFDILTGYRWDEKVVLVLAAFAITYGELLLVNQLYHQNQLAASVSDLRKIPTTSKEIQHRFKAMRSLFNILTGLTKDIIRLCMLPMHHIPLNDDLVSLANTQEYTAAYWVIKATLICCSRVTHLVSSKPEPALWELTSIASQLRSISNNLKHNVETCQRQIEQKLHLRLVNLHNEVHEDNQEVLRVLLGMQDDFPLKDCASRAKPKTLSELKNKIVLLLVSTPCPNAKTLILLTNKLHHHPELKDRYKIVWVPIPLSTSWSETDKKSFNHISNSLPLWSIRRPWQLRRAVVEYITQKFNFKGQMIMPVLDEHGAVVSFDALSMALVWGADAFPFSDSREYELWKNADLTIEFLLNDLDPLASTWIEEGRNICILGGNGAEWIEQIYNKMKSMIDAGLEVKIIYVGPKNFSHIVKSTLGSSGSKTPLKVSLLVTGLELFWLRLESMRRSKLRTPRANSNDDMIMHQLEKLLNKKCSKDGWTIFGTPKDAIQILQGMEVMEYMTKVTSLGMKRSATDDPPTPEPPSSPKAGPCGHFKAVAYTEELLGQNITCDHCHRTMEMFFISE